MTRDERNRKISELRETLGKIEVKGNSSFSSVGFFAVKDWHADQNWPTLLREMFSAPTEQSTAIVGNDGFFSMNGTPATRPEFLADAVCEAWLQWKEHGRTT